MMHFFTFLISILALIDYNHGLNCYYCLPCNGTNARNVTCAPDKNFCSLSKGTDYGEEKTVRRCEASTTAVSGTCYSNGTYDQYTNVQACLCNTDLCNFDYSYFTTTTTPLAKVTATEHTATFIINELTGTFVTNEPKSTYTTTTTSTTTLSSNTTRSSASYAMNSNKVVFLILFSVLEKLTILC